MYLPNSNMIPHKLTDEDIDKMTLMDDILMNYVFKDNKELAQYFIRTILDNDDLIVTDIDIQSFIPGISNRKAILDIVATDSTGKLYNIELQNITERATAKRARYHRSKLDQASLPRGNDFETLPDTYVIFITRKDFFKRGLPLYHIKQEVEELNEDFPDGTHIIYVNAEIDDNKTALGRLMHDIKTPDPDNMNCEIMKQNIANAKGSEGRCEMTTGEIMKDIGYGEGWNAGHELRSREIAKNLKDDNVPMETIIKWTGLSEEEINNL